METLLSWNPRDIEVPSDYWYSWHLFTESLIDAGGTSELFARLPEPDCAFSVDFRTADVPFINLY